MDGVEDSSRKIIESRIRDLLGKPRARVVWSVEGEVADVLVGADSVTDPVWAALRFLLRDVRFAAWDVAAEDEYGGGAATLEELLAAGERAAARPGSRLARAAAGEAVGA